MPLTFDQLELLVRDPLVKLSDIRAYLDVVLNNDSINDRNMLLEKLLVLMARLSQGDKQMQDVSQRMQEFTIDYLYKDLPHPPSDFLAQTVPPPSNQPSAPNPKYASRPADGSNYTPFAPMLGMAGAPYARSVPGAAQINPKNLPSPELVFDSLLARPKVKNADGKEEDQFTPHPGGVSALFFAFADLVIHSIFNTNPRDWTINMASSYLDLSVLYGSTEKEVNAGRRKDGTGRLHEDVFLDRRLLGMPPATCALLVLLCRNHNYFAERILRINERGVYASSETDEAKKAAQDEEIFSRARLINCGFFMHIILGDYVGAILGMVRDGFKWRLDPLMEFRRPNHEPAPRGTGNAVSIEFNLLYRWHATLSRPDTQWTSGALKKVLGDDVNPREVTRDEFHQAVRDTIKVSEDPREWTFHSLKRDARGRFDDGELAKILLDSTKARAAQFGAKGIPEALRIIEIMSIEQSRSWGACSLNEFRKFMGLKPYANFKAWNSDPEVYSTAEAIYRDIDNLELHVGMQAEEAKKPGPGAGLCPGYTISRAILADAVCLTRGDPYLTVNFTPFHFTTFGFNDCQYDHLDGTFGGGLLTKLLFRHLPRHYTPRSAYAHFPFLDPAYVRTLNVEAEKTGSNVTTKIPIEQYDWEYPKPISVNVVESAKGVSAVLQATRDDLVVISSDANVAKTFTAPYDSRLRSIIPDLGDKLPDTSAVHKLLLQDQHKHAAWFARTARELIASASLSAQGSGVQYLDVVKDVLNVLPALFIANELMGLPWTDEYVEMFREVGRCVYVNLEAEYDWHLREVSSATFEKVRTVVKGHLDGMSSWLGVDAAPLSTLKGGEDARAFLKELVATMNESGKTSAIVALFVEVVPTAAHFSQALAHAVNYALIQGRSVSGDLNGLVDEALKADPLVWGTYRTALKDLTLPDSTRVRAGEKVWLSVANALKDGNGLKDDARWAGVGRHGLLDPTIFSTVAPGVLQEVLKLPGLVKDDGGGFHRFVELRNGSQVQQYVDGKGNVTPFPASLKVKYGK